MRTIIANEVILENNIQTINLKKTGLDAVKRIVKTVHEILKLVCGLICDKDDLTYTWRPTIGMNGPMAYRVDDGNIKFFE